MRRHLHSTRTGLFLVLTMALLAASLGAAPPKVVIPEGTDCWRTEPGTEHTLDRLPADFFSAGSKALPKTTIQLVGVPLPANVVTGAFPPSCGCPKDNVHTVITWVDRHGNPTNSIKHAVKEVVTTKIDTCVRRTLKADFPGQGAAVKVDIRLVALSLKSVAPLTVPYTNGTTRKFDVFVTQSANQEPGSMTFTAGNLKEGKANGDVRLRKLPIAFDLELREVVPAGTRPIVRRLTNQKLTLEGTKGTFTFSGVKL